MSKKRSSQIEVSKRPCAEFSPTKNKIPRAILTPSEDCKPDFRTDLMDLNGPWRWNLCETEIQEYTRNLLSWEQLSWRELSQRGCHLVSISMLIPKAQKRLRELERQDLDELYSLRLSGKKRIWCIKDNNILWLLWWDPLHSICLSKKKHT